MVAWLIVWVLVALLGAIGLHAIAPRHCRGLYLLPAARTVFIITTATALVAAVWSH
ncbi:hypothetical protein [Streptomyces phaeochromogenes]|uniref:hypothetical protein n=1 Tax=Streptomyces phaeochromogenes TaxID=1923 RepID=UPI002DD7BC20|nr:hypothetical protein [Streptomyces phaeochromogenes]WRZ30199.1 hypothetical protein OG931_21835 [Streptomyces phaeochromogenes]